MTQNTKINLSEQELQMAADYQWILTKRLVMDKMAALLGMAEPGLRQLTAENKWLPEALHRGNNKLSRGENYRGLPWLLLDSPAFFSKQDVFAVRTLFWWGHGFSVTLHLSGSSKTRYLQTMQQRFSQLQAANWLVCINEEEWEHHFEQDNYLPAAALTKEAWLDLLAIRPFTKVAVRFALTQWAEIPALTQAAAGRMLEWLKP